ncbi:L-lactate permease [Eubacteriales bacterium OttesenSCG-928-A19]|nr:L-lactate permease [Eubacteriales bacterium OttesenSCG-928-A19]
MLTALAFLPIVAVVALLVVLSWPAKRVMPCAWAIGVLLALLVWRMDIRTVLAFSAFGGLKGLETLVTIIGAVLLLNTLRQSGAMRVISRNLSSISGDRRVQALIIGWMFTSFIEGAAGFGTPAAITAPLMIGLGFPPMAAAMFALICNSTAVAFGVVGVPTLTALSQVEPNVIAAGMNVTAFDTAVVRLTACLHGCAGLFLPFLALCMLTKLFGRERSFKPALEALPFALLSGAAFVVPSIILAYVAGPEFPSLIGALIGLVIVVLAAYKGICVPKRTWDFSGYRDEPAPPAEEVRDEAVGVPAREMSSFMAWLPYVLIALILIVSRIPFFGLSAPMKSAVLRIPGLLGIEGLDYEVRYLWLPGTVFLLVSCVTAILHRMTGADMRSTLRATGKQVYGAVIAMVFCVALVQLMLNSGQNASGYDGMIMMISVLAANVFRQFFIAISPFIGVLGTFVSGSNTISNMLFASMQFETASLLGLPEILIVSLQCVGGGAGSMIGINTTVAACSTSNLAGREGELIRRNLVPCALYCLFIVAVAAISNALGFPYVMLGG